MVSWHVAIVGATGLVGREIINVLEHRKFPVGKLTLLASTRSIGKRFYFAGQPIAVQELTENSFHDVQLAIFSAGSDVSLKFAPLAVQAGCIVIDNSSAFRLREDVPLVIPEINPAALRRHHGIIANPNCTTAITLMALYPLYKRFGVKRIIASSYQAVSGTGAKAVSELEQQVRQIVQGKVVTNKVYPRQIAFNVLPLIGNLLPSGYTEEEIKMQEEGRKIMGHPTFQASVTCVRVPVYRAHSIAVTAECVRHITVDDVRQTLLAAPGIDVVDDPSQFAYPTPLDVSGRYNCQVGRIRKDDIFKNGLSFWVVGDQLLKGAALNAVQIAELLLANQ